MKNNNLLYIALLLCSNIFTCEFLTGVYYFAGWWSKPKPSHYLDQGVDWRQQFPEREPLLGWFDDTQCVIDNEILQAVFGGIDFFAFDFYTDRPDNPRYPGSRANNNNGLKFYLTSPYKKFLKFALLYANADRFEITDFTEWDFYTDLWVKLFLEPEYLKINGKPVFIILGGLQIEGEFGSLANAKLALQIFRQKAEAAGFPDILIGGGIPRPSEPFINRGVQIGFDFFTSYGVSFSTFPAGPMDYSLLAGILTQNWDIFAEFSPIGYAPITIQGHDRRPIDNNPGVFFVNKSPQIYNQQLQLAKTFIDQNPQLWIDGTQKMIMMYAWNEIGEGGQIQPTKIDCTAYVDQIKQVFH